MVTSTSPGLPRLLDCSVMTMSKLAPLLISVAKWEAVAALPPMRIARTRRLER